LNRLPPKIFLDTSAIFSAIYSSTGGARELLRLGEMGIIQLVVSLDVLSELDENLRVKAPNKLVTLAAVMNLSRVAVTQPPDVSTIQECQQWLQYSDDAVVTAAAVIASVDYFVTLDRQHFLGNKGLQSSVSFRFGTPGDCLAWLRLQLIMPPKLL
jgi:predicted nucleic acid-binding protein